MRGKGELLVIEGEMAVLLEELSDLELIFCGFNRAGRVDDAAA